MQSLNTIKEKLKAALPVLKSRYPIEKLGVFGSATRSDFTAKSDIDILVEFNGEIGWEFIDLAAELEKTLGRKVDLVSRRGIKSRHWEYIKDDLVYV